MNELERAKKIVERAGYKVKKRRLLESDIQRTAFGTSKNSEHIVSTNPEDYVKYFRNLEDIVDINAMIVSEIIYFGSQRTGYVELAVPVTVSDGEAIEKLESVYGRKVYKNPDNSEWEVSNAVLTRSWKRGGKKLDPDQLYLVLSYIRGVKEEYRSAQKNFGTEIKDIISSLTSIGWDIHEKVESAKYIGELTDDDSRSLSKETLRTIKSMGFVKVSYRRADVYTPAMTRYIKEDIGARLEYSRKKDSLYISIEYVKGKYLEL